MVARGHVTDRTITKYVEMVLFLHGNLDLIPEDIPELPAEGPNSVQTKIPGRLADPNPELEELSGAFSPVDLTGEEATDVL